MGARRRREWNSSLDSTWAGNAADAAYIYFDELAKKLTGCRETFDSLQSTYERLAHADYSTAEAIKGVLGGIMDGLIIVGVEMAAGTLLSWTGAGALVGYGLAALEITRLINLWGDATKLFAQAQTIVNGGVGVLESLGAEIYGNFRTPGDGPGGPLRTGRPPRSPASGRVLRRPRRAHRTGPP